MIPGQLSMSSMFTKQRTAGAGRPCSVRTGRADQHRALELTSSPSRQDGNFIFWEACSLGNPLDAFPPEILGRSLDPIGWGVIPLLSFAH